ncbi:MAG: hypothetical protein J2P55_01465, partial [Rhizobiales bacterium]|nr:hypothetical protein [Hyphomicrobiales bacterium]
TIGLDYADFMPPVAYDPNQTVLVWNQSTNQFQLVQLTALPIDNTAWTPWTPVFGWGVTGTGATFNLTFARYKQIGKTCFISVSVSVPSIGSGNSGGLTFTLPVPQGNPNLIGHGREQAINGKSLNVYLGDSTHGSLQFYDNSSPITAGAGASFIFGGFYETT